MAVPRARSPDSIEAEKLYKSGMALVDIAKKLRLVGLLARRGPRQTARRAPLHEGGKSPPVNPMPRGDSFDNAADPGRMALSEHGYGDVFSNMR